MGNVIIERKDAKILNQIPEKDKINKKLKRRVSSQNKHPLIVPQKQKPKTELIVEVKAVTMKYEGLNLFDYHSRDIHCQKFRIKESTSFGYRNGALEKTSEGVNYEYVIKIEKKEGKFYVLKPDQTSNKSAYIVVQSLRDRHRKFQRGYCLVEGDKVRFGEMDFSIRKLFLKDQSKEKNPEDLTKPMHVVKYHSTINPINIFDVNIKTKEFEEDKRKAEEAGEELSCKYCLLDSVAEDPMDDLLINPCQCTGGSKYVHVICLRHWLSKKLETGKGEGVKIFNMDSLFCEICKEVLKRYVKCNDKVVDIANLPEHEESFFILDQLDKNEKINKKYEIHVLENKGDEVSVGGGNNSDLKLGSDSVSKHHGGFRFEDNGFYLYDNDSRYGSLVKMRFDWYIGFNKFAIQIEKTVVSFILKEKILD
jgi:hypothetical protein